MKNFIFVLGAFALIQFSTAETVGDAEHRLKVLRDLTTKRVDEAFLEHSEMSNEVDKVALQTKLHGTEEIEKKTEKYLAKLKSDRALTHRCRGTRDHIFHHLKQQHTNDLIRCVDQHGAQSVGVLRRQRQGLVEYVWNAIYEEEKHIIVCGRRPDCLGGAVADVQDKLDEVTRVIHDEVDISRHNTKVQIQSIKECAAKAIANAEHALSKVPTCVY